MREESYLRSLKSLVGAVTTCTASSYHVGGLILSIQAVSWVLEFSKSRTFDRLVLISIANYAHRDGSGSCPSTKTISEEAGVSERQVRYSVAELVKIGELTVKYKASDYGTNIYTLEKMHAASHAALGTERPSPPSRKTPGTDPARTRQACAPDPIEPHPIEPTATTIPQSVDGFDLFWKEYPKKVERIAAKKVWLQIPSVESHVPEILEGLSRWKAVWSDPQFIPYPDKFLRRRKWEDEVPVNGGQNGRSKEQTRTGNTAQNILRAFGAPGALAHDVQPAIPRRDRGVGGAGVPRITEGVHKHRD